MPNARVERHGPHVAELVLDRPEALNALSTAFATELADTLGELAGDDGVRALVLSSSQAKAFCVGADLKERNAFGDADLRAQRVVYRRFSAALLGVPVPVVAAVAGFALGGGYEIALSCDLVVADDTAVVGLPEASVGVIPGLGGTQLLPRRAGTAVAADLIFTGRRVTAAEALTLRCVDRVVPAGTAREAALELAAHLATRSPVALRNAKRAIRLGAAPGLQAGLEVEDSGWRATAFSADRAEGVAAFAQKRAPDWPGLP